MFVYSALLGPFLDGYHSAFGVLQYTTPHALSIGNVEIVTTDLWVPPLFGVAGIIMGSLYVLLDEILGTPTEAKRPAWPLVFLGISAFSAQYYLSGYLTALDLDLPAVTAFLAVWALASLWLFDRTKVNGRLAMI
jgi:hypothetical protein